MAITTTSLTTGFNSTDAQSYQTGVITPSVDKLILAAVTNTRVSAADTVTLSGCGVTWVSIATSLNRDGTARLTVFRAMGSPTAGTVTVTVAGSSNTSCIWSIAELSNTATGLAYSDTYSDTYGGSHESIVQSSISASNTQVTSYSTTLGAFESASNATYGAVTQVTNSSTNPGAGFTQIHAQNHGFPGNSLLAEFNVGNDTTVDASWNSGAVYAIAFGLEVELGQLNATVLPGVIVTTTALPAATVSVTAQDATPTPGVIVTTVALPEASNPVEPAVIVAITALPAASVVIDETTTPGVIATSVLFPQTGIESDIDAIPLPGVIATVVALPQATGAFDIGFDIDFISVLVELPAASASAGATVTPAVIALPVALPASTRGITQDDVPGGSASTTRVFAGRATNAYATAGSATNSQD